MSGALSEESAGNSYPSRTGSGAILASLWLAWEGLGFMWAKKREDDYGRVSGTVISRNM